MPIETTRFGALELSEESVFTFPEGLPGIEGKRFALLERGPRLAWLQSLSEPAVALLLVDPGPLRPDFAFSPRPEEAAIVDPASATGGLIVRVIAWGDRQDARRLLLNLFAPILLNPVRRLGMQLPLVGSSFTTREVWPSPPSEAVTTSATLEQSSSGGHGP